MTDFIIVYTLSDMGSMVKDCIRSSRSLRKFTDAPIHVIITPPIPPERVLKKLITHDVKTKTNLCDLMFTHNKTDGFKIREHTRFGRFGEKIGSLSMMDSENILFLDCDTVALRDPEELFKHDFDFSARIDNGFSLVEWNKWADLFGARSNEIKPMFNAGVMAFKNNACQKIMRDALRYMGQPLPKYGEYYQKDQLAISLSLSGYKIRCMDRRDHGFRWLDEPHDSVIYHGSRRNPLKRIGFYLRNLRDHYA